MNQPNSHFTMSPILILALLLGFFALLLLISRLTRSKRFNPNNFYLGDRQAHWLVISLGMIGVSLSGVSFISVPGWVATARFTYMQMVLGYIVGYVIIAYLLLPVYYRLRIPSIYSYLSDRFGPASYLAGSSIFIITRLAITALRIFLVATVLHPLILGQWGLPTIATIALMVTMIWVYTRSSGMQTIIRTDLFQTAVMITTVILMLYALASALDLSFTQSIKAIYHSPYSQIFEFKQWHTGEHFLKQFLAGAIIPVVMTGLDQNMMQKNLACRSLRDAQKNMILNGFSYIPVNLLLLSLGALILIYSDRSGTQLPAAGDAILPYVATQIPNLAGPLTLLFIIGIIAVTFSSSDSALTALTTTFCLDILKINEKAPHRTQRTRKVVHLALALALILLAHAYHLWATQSTIALLFSMVSFLYGPLLGLYAFGLFTKLSYKEKFAPLALLLPPIACFALRTILQKAFAYTLGYELLILNGALTFLLLYLFRTKEKAEKNAPDGTIQSVHSQDITDPIR